MQKKVAPAVLSFHKGRCSPRKIIPPSSEGRERYHQTSKPSSHVPLFRISDWRVGHVLGQGQFGTVVQARNIHTRKVVAWKRYETPRLLSGAERGSRVLELLDREIRIHRSLDHPNILSFLGHIVSVEYVTLVLDYAERGDLFDYSNKRCVTSLDRVRLFHQVYPGIIAAATYLESIQIAHRDIKPENILLKTSPTNDASVEPQLCDFGWSVFYLKAGKSASTLCGTPEYLPPELLQSRRRYKAEFVDRWALGVLALELLLGESPFQAETRSSIYAKILSFRGSLDHSVHAGLNSMVATAVTHGIVPPTSPTAHVHCRDCNYASLVEDFLQSIPTQRMSATDCLKRYAHLLGPNSNSMVVSPLRPSIKQRREVFQNTCSERASFLLFS